MREILIDTKAVNKGHYVPGMISRGVLYISGQLPMNHETGIMETGDIAAFFGEHRPARVVVSTRDLHHGVLVEIEATAEMPE